MMDDGSSSDEDSQETEMANLVRCLKSSFLDTDYVFEEKWKICNIQSFCCKDSFDFNQKKQELFNEGHSTMETCYFLMYASSQKHRFGFELLSADYLTKLSQFPWSPSENLGRYYEGVTVFRYVDVLLRFAEANHLRSPRIAVYKVIPGRSKVKFCSVGDYPPPLEPPDPEYDSFQIELDSNTELKHFALHHQMHFSEIFLYDFQTVKRKRKTLKVSRTQPRQTWPVALVQFKLIVPYIVPRPAVNLSRPFMARCGYKKLIVPQGAVKVAVKEGLPPRKKQRKLCPKPKTVQFPHHLLLKEDLTLSSPSNQIAASSLSSAHHVYHAQHVSSSPQLLSSTFVTCSLHREQEYLYNKAPPTSSQHGEVSHTVDLVSQAIKESGVLPDSTSSPGNRRISLEEGHSLLDISQLFNNERNASLETADVVARDDRCGVGMRNSSTIDSSSLDLSINRFLHGLNNQSLLDLVKDVGFPEDPSNGGESSKIDQPEVVGTSSAPDGFRKDCDKITGLENTSIDEQNDSNMFDMINQILGDPVNESNNSSESPVGGQLLNTSEGVLTTPDCAKNVPNNSDENKICHESNTSEPLQDNLASLSNQDEDDLQEDPQQSSSERCELIIVDDISQDNVVSSASDLIQRDTNVSDSGKNFSFSSPSKLDFVNTPGQSPLIFSLQDTPRARQTDSSSKTIASPLMKLALKTQRFKTLNIEKFGKSRKKVFVRKDFTGIKILSQVVDQNNNDSLAKSTPTATPVYSRLMRSIERRPRIVKSGRKVKQGKNVQQKWFHRKNGLDCSSKRKSSNHKNCNKASRQNSSPEVSSGKSDANVTSSVLDACGIEAADETVGVESISDHTSVENDDMMMISSEQVSSTTCLKSIFDPDSSGTSQNTGVGSSQLSDVHAVLPDRESLEKSIENEKVSSSFTSIKNSPSSSPSLVKRRRLFHGRVMVLSKFKSASPVNIPLLPGRGEQVPEDPRSQKRCLSKEVDLSIVLWMNENGNAVWEETSPQHPAGKEPDELNDGHPQKKYHNIAACSPGFEEVLDAPSSFDTYVSTLEEEGRTNNPPDDISDCNNVSVKSPAKGIISACETFVEDSTEMSISSCSSWKYQEQVSNTRGTEEDKSRSDHKSRQELAKNISKDQSHRLTNRFSSRSLSALYQNTDIRNQEWMKKNNFSDAHEEKQHVIDGDKRPINPVSNLRINLLLFKDGSNLSQDFQESDIHCNDDNSHHNLQDEIPFGFSPRDLFNDSYDVSDEEMPPAHHPFEVKRRAAEMNDKETLQRCENRMFHDHTMQSVNSPSNKSSSPSIALKGLAASTSSLQSYHAEEKYNRERYSSGRHNFRDSSRYDARDSKFNQAHCYNSKPPISYNKKYADRPSSGRVTPDFPGSTCPTRSVCSLPPYNVMRSRSSLRHPHGSSSPPRRHDYGWKTIQCKTERQHVSQQFWPNYQEPRSSSSHRPETMPRDHRHHHRRNTSFDVRDRFGRESWTSARR
ncbi:unnamed protein product [Clavelina lepadiformis]|uniref:Uncharacterized protein n=2 Tax=Clavelina lepadiformis TaxID=159417 RepID=A0ABP0GC93_CLALP